MDQAIGFLLEFENRASDGLREATTDFDTATKAFERAVDAAQAAFTFLEEGQGGAFQKAVNDATDAVIAKSADLRSAMDDISGIEIEAPNFDPIQKALDDFKGSIQEPLDSGVEEVGGDDAAEYQLVPEDFEQFQAFVTAAEDPIEVAAPETDAFTSGLEDVQDAAQGFGQSTLPVLSDLDVALDKAATRLWDDLLPGMEDFGQAGKNATKAIAVDAVSAFEKLQSKAQDFLETNQESFAKASDTAKVWEEFLDANDSDIRKIQDLLRVADKVDLKPMVEDLAKALGDASLADAFWAPIRANKAVDQEFFEELRKVFKKEDKTYTTWWERMNTTMKKVFWPVFSAEGNKATKGIASYLGGALKRVFESPIAQFTAAIQLSKIIDQLFGPAIEELTDIIGRFLMPFMRELLRFTDALRPSFVALQEATTPLVRAFGELLRELADALLPAAMSFADFCKSLAPTIISLAKVITQTLGLALASMGDGLGFVAQMGGLVLWVVGGLLSTLAAIIHPIVSVVGWLLEMSGVSKLLGLVFMVGLIPALVSFTYALFTTQPPMFALIASTWAYIKALALATYNNYLLSWTLIRTYVPAVWTGIKAGWAWVTSLTLQNIWTGIVTAGTWLLTAAQWALNIALDANPIGLVILAVALLVAGFVGLTHWLGITVDWVELLGYTILGVMGPIGWAIVAVIYFWDELKAGFSEVSSLFQPFIDGISAIWGEFKAFFVEMRTLIQPLINWVRGVGEWVAAFFKQTVAFVKPLLGWVSAAGVAVIRFVAKMLFVFNPVVIALRLVVGLFTLVGRAISYVTELVGGWLSESLDGLVTLFGMLSKAIFGVSDPIGWLVSAVGYLVSGVEITFSAIGRFFDLVSAKAERVIDFFKDWGSVIALVVSGPMGWLIASLSGVIKLLASMSIDLVPGWVRWLLGVGTEVEQETPSQTFEDVASDVAVDATSQTFGEVASDAVATATTDTPWVTDNVVADEMATVGGGGVGTVAVTVMPQPAAVQPIAPQGVGLNVGQVSADIEPEPLTGENSKVIVAAIERQTRALIDALNAGLTPDVDLDLFDLKELADFN